MDVLLRASDAGRAVFVTSGAAQSHQALLGPLRRHQGRVERARPHLCGRDAEHEPGEGDARQSRPAAHADARRRLCRAKYPETLPRTPEELAPRLVALCRPDWTETGKLYDFPTDSKSSISRERPKGAHAAPPHPSMVMVMVVMVVMMMVVMMAEAAVMAAVATGRLRRVAQAQMADAGGEDDARIRLDRNRLQRHSVIGAADEDRAAAADAQRERAMRADIIAGQRAGTGGAARRHHARRARPDRRRRSPRRHR